MEYRRLGHSGLHVSPICLGTMMFGLRTDATVAGRIVARAREAGINFIDTADIYAKGASEEIVGDLIRAERDDWVLATKVGNAMGETPNMGGLGRKWLLRAIDDSLRRLRTDHVDIYYLHKPDPGTPIEETLGAIGDIIAAGKARFFGISNFRGWQHADIVHQCERLGVPRPIVSQPYYNAMNRMPEVEVLPACAHYGLGVVPYSPLARGVLTGKYKPGEAPPQDTRAAVKDRRLMETEFRTESMEYAQRIKERAEARGMTAGQFALNWVLANPIVTAVLAGPRTEAQWEEYLDALDHAWDPDDEAFIDAMVRPGHPSTPGYNDPQYPITGRPV
ncbi:MAG: aldo/keto reductase [Alphaproteobacteria bacterium]|nr:MAG: aldo/keto reductase [Alphaproteobacteria bacterium]